MSNNNEDYFSLPEKLFEPGTEPKLQHHIHHYSNLNLFSRNWDKYFEKELDYIKKSPFGAFYRLAKENKFLFSGAFVHFLLANQLATKRKYEIWSVIGGQPIRFSLDEFGYITGLSCDHYPTINVEDDKDINNRWTRMLVSNFCPTLPNLEIMALTCREWTREDRIRLAYLLILAGVLLAKNRTTPLPRKYIELVKNINKFERYPWGRAAFEVLIGSIHEVKDDLCNPTYVINGFIEVIQIWGYEAIPLIAKMVKVHAKGDSHESVMLKWKGSRRMKDFLVLNEYINKVDVHHFFGNVDPLNLFSPRWSDEIHDPLVCNLIGYILSNKNFDIDFWVGHGVRVGPSSQMKEKSLYRVKRKKISIVQDQELDQTEDFVTQVYLESCIEKLHKSISEGFERLGTQLKEMNRKISELESK